MFVNKSSGQKTQIFDGSNRCFAIFNYFAGHMAACVTTDQGVQVLMRYKNARRDELSLVDHPELRHNFENFTLQVMKFDDMSEEEVSSVALVLNLGTPMCVGERVRLLMGTPRSTYLSELHDETWVDKISASPCFMQDGAGCYLWLSLLVRAEVDAAGDPAYLTLPKRLYHYRALELWFIRTDPIPVRFREQTHDPVRRALLSLSDYALTITTRDHLNALYVALRRFPDLTLSQTRAVSKAAEGASDPLAAALAAAG
jgi:hypothetical protein